MLEIRPEQWDALAAVMERRLEQRLTHRVEAQFPPEAAEYKSMADGDQRLREFVRKTIDRATAYGIEEEADFLAFLVLMLASARLAKAGSPGFLAWTRPILEREQTPGRVKMAFIDHRLRDMAQDDRRAVQVVALLDAAQGRAK